MEQTVNLSYRTLSYFTSNVHVLFPQNAFRFYTEDPGVLFKYIVNYVYAEQIPVGKML